MGTFVQFKGAEGSSTSASVTMSSAPTNGNVLFAFVTSAVGSEVIGSGWTSITIQGESGLDGCWAVKTAGASESTTQTPFTVGSGTWTCAVWEWSGVSSTNNGFIVTQSTAATPPAVTLTKTPTSGTGDIALVGGAVNENGSGTATITQGGVGITIDGSNATGNGAVWGHATGIGSGSQSFVATMGSGTANKAMTGGLLFVKSSGGTPFTQAVSGVTSFAGSTTKDTIHRITGPIISFAGSVVKATTHVITASQTYAGSILKATTHKVTAAAQYSGSVAKSTNHVLAAVQTFAGSLKKATSKGMSAAFSFAGSLVTTKGKSLTAALSFSGASRNATAKALAAASSFAGVGQKSVSRAVSAITSFSGALSRGHTVSLAAVLSFVGSIARGVGSQRNAALTFAGATARTITHKIPAGTLAFVGSLTQPGNVFSQALSAALSFGTGKVIQFGAATALTGTSATVTMSQAPKQGNVLVAFFLSDGGSEVIGSGWTNITIQSEPNLDGCWAYKSAGPGESTSQTPYSMASANWACGIWEIAGAVTSPSNDGFVVVATSASTSPTITASATAGNNGDLALMMAGINRSSLSAGVITGVTTDATNNLNLGYVAAHAAGAQAGVNSYTCTWNGTPAAAPTMGILYLTPTRSLAKTVGKALPAGGLFVGAMQRAAVLTRNLASAALSFAGSIVNGGGHTLALSGTLSFAGVSQQIRGHLSALAAALSFAGANQNATTKAAPGGLVVGGALSKNIARIFSGILGLAGSFPKQIVRPLTGAVVVLVGNIAGLYGHLVLFTANLAMAGSTTRTIVKLLAASFSALGLVQKTTTHIVSGALSFAGGFAKRTGVAVSAALSFLGKNTFGRSQALIATLQFVSDATRNVTTGLVATSRTASALAKDVAHGASGILSSTGAAMRNLGRPLSGIVSFVGLDLTHNVGHTISAALLQAGTVAKGYISSGFFAVLQSASTFLKTASPDGQTHGALSFTGAKQSGVQKAIATALSAASALPRSITRGLTAAALSFSGIVARASGAFIAFTATLSFVGSAGKTPLKNTIATLSVTGATRKATSRSLQATVVNTGSFIKSIGVAVTASLSFLVAFLKGRLAFLASALPFAGTAQRSTGKAARATMALVGTMGGRTLVIIRATVLQLSAQLPRSITHRLPGVVLSFGGSIQRAFERAFTALLSFLGSINHNQVVLEPDVYVLNTALVTKITLGTKLSTAMVISDMKISTTYTVNLPPLT